MSRSCGYRFLMVRWISVALLLLVSFAAPPVSAFVTDDDGSAAAVGVIRIEDLGPSWFASSADVDDQNQTLADDVGLPLKLTASPIESLALDSGLGNKGCLRHRGAATATPVTVAVSPVFRVASVPEIAPSATTSFQNAVSAFGSPREARKALRQIRSRATLHCVEGQWRDQFLKVAPQVFQRLTGESGTDQADKRLQEYTKTTARRVRDSTSTSRFFGSFITALPRNDYFGGAIAIEFVRSSRFILTYVVGSFRLSLARNGDPGISQRRVDELNKMMAEAATAANDRLRSALSPG